MMPHVCCPDADTLKRYLNGDITAEDAEAFEQHLPGCRDCLTALAGIRAGDGLIRALHGAATCDTPPEMADLIERVQRLAEKTPSAPETIQPETGKAPAELPGDVPTQLGRYVIREKLSAGGMGTVYLADDPQFRREVAVKVPRFSGSPDQQQQARQRFLREARAAAAVRHPHLCPVYDLGEAGEIPYIVMPYVRTGSLADRLRQSGRFDDCREAVRLVTQVAEGLGALHAAGIVHRDLKPANILLDENRPLVADFGLARTSVVEDSVTSAGHVVGTPMYMAPELVSNESIAMSPRIDVYSLGVVLYQMLTGRLPVEGTPLAILGRLVAGNGVRSVHEHRPDVDPRLARIVEQATSREPAQRFADARELADALLAWLAEPQPGDRATPTAPLATPRRPQRWRLGLAGAGLAAALLLIAIVLQPGKGKLVIEIDPASKASVHVLQGGKVIKVVDADSNTTLEITPGEYDFVVVDKVAGTQTRASSFTLQRRGVKVIDVRLELDQARAAQPSGLDQLKREDVPDEALRAARGANPKLPLPGVVAILGDERLTQWHSAWSVCYSAAGDKLYSGGGDYQLREWDAKTGRQLRLLASFRSTVTFLSLTPQGKRLACGTLDGTVKVLDPLDGEVVREVDHGSWVTGVALCPDEQHLATAGLNREVKVWDLRTGAMRFALKGHTKPVFGVAYSSDGKSLVSGSCDRNPEKPGEPGEVKVWNATTGVETATLPGVPLTGSSVAVSPNNEWIASGCADGTIRLSGLGAAKQGRSLMGHTGTVLRLTFSPDGSRLLSGSGDGTVRLWDVAQGKEVLRLSILMWPRSVAFRPDGKRVVTSDPANGIRLWDATSGEELPPTASERGGVHGVAVSPNANAVAVARESGAVNVWEVRSGRARVLPALRDHSREVRAVAFHPRGEWLASVSADSTVKVWDWANARVMHTLSGHRGQVGHMQFASDGALLVTADSEGGIKAWDVTTTGKMSWEFTRPNQCTVLALSADGKRVATTGKDGRVRVRDVVAQRDVLEFQAAGVPIEAISFTANGLKLLTGDHEGKVRIWEATSGKELACEETHRGTAPRGRRRTAHRTLAGPGRREATPRSVGRSRSTARTTITSVRPTVSAATSTTAIRVCASITGTSRS